MRSVQADGTGTTYILPTQRVEIDGQLAGFRT